VIVRRSNRRTNAARVEELCRRLDANELRAFLQERAPRRYAKIKHITDLQATAAMHKVRLHEFNFTDTEKAVSRDWLRDHGFTQEIDYEAELRSYEAELRSDAAAEPVVLPFGVTIAPA
jgi:hypothetical protein